MPMNAFYSLSLSLPPIVDSPFKVTVMVYFKVSKRHCLTKDHQAMWWVVRWRISLRTDSKRLGENRQRQAKAYVEYGCPWKGRKADKESVLWMQEHHGLQLSTQNGANRTNWQKGAQLAPKCFNPATGIVSPKCTCIFSITYIDYVDNSIPPFAAQRPKSLENGETNSCTSYSLVATNKCECSTHSASVNSLP